MKKHLQQQTVLINLKYKKLRQLIIISILFLICNVNYSQVNPTSETYYTPSGIFDNVFDKDGTIYKLSDITAGKNYVSKSGATTSNTLLCTSGIFELYFETGCGMENTTIAIHNQRRAILCQAFQDISDFINTPLKNVGNTNKVKIWIRNPANLTPAMPAAAAGAASAFYNLPIFTSALPAQGLPYISGIVDNEIWKTIQTGLNSFTNTVFPIISTQNNTGFYHGWASFNFAGTVNWNLDYNKYNSGTGYVLNSSDFYTVIIHEVTHALGFNSLINYNGTSILSYPNSLNGVYYTRYDKNLKTSTNTSLISNNTATFGQMYNFNFTASSSSLYPSCSLTPPVFNGNSGAFNCPTSIKYVGSVTVPVYNSPCFENGSSLSHFEDACYNGNTNDQYFMMSERASGLFAKRTLTNEERQVLCDIGYSVKGTFGNTTNFTYKNYGVTACSGITVAGVNDGFTTTGTYSYQGNSGTDITISGILNNDYTGGLTSNLRFEFVQDVYDPNALLSATTGSSSFTIKSFVPGLHLLRYVPFDIATGQRGNITYIFVNVLNNCVANNPCNLVRNGNFEEHNYPPTFNSQIYKACGWQNASYLSSCDYFNSDYTSTFYPGAYSIPCNSMGYAVDNVAGNQGYAGMYVTAQSSESIKTELISPLVPNTQYQLTFDVALAEHQSNRSVKFQAFITDQNLDLTTFGTIPTANITSGTVFLTNTNFSNIAVANANGWEKITLNFTTGSNPNLRYLYIGGLNNIQLQVETPLPLPGAPCNINVSPNIGCYYYVDNVSLTRVLAPNFLDAINDNFSSPPIISSTGGVTTSVYANDLYNAVASTSASLPNVTFALVAPLSIAGATINSSGLISIPAGTPAGTYTLTYRLSTIGNCNVTDTATVTIFVTNSNITPNIVPGIRANNLVNHIELQSTGKSIISGAFTTYNNISKPYVARLNTDLTLDQTFTFAGNQGAMDLAIQSDNKIIAATWSAGFGGTSLGISRLLPDGAVDTSFNTGGTGISRNISYTNEMAYACAIQTDGYILLGGDFYYYNGVQRLGIVKIQPNGQIDTLFNPTVLNTYYRSVVTGITIQPDGKIILLGFFSPPTAGATQKNIIRLTATGDIDPTFTAGDTVGSLSYNGNLGVSLYSPIAKAVVEPGPNGKIIIAGAFSKYNSNNVKSLVRLTSTGAIDATFNTTTGVNRAINELILEPTTNKPIIGGEFTLFGTTAVKKLIRLTTSGALDTTFNIGTGTTDSVVYSSCPFCTNYVKALKQQTDGKIIVGGKFTTFNGLSATNITRIFGSAGLQAKGSGIEFQSEPEIDITLENKITIYPNPSDGIYYFNLTEEDSDTQIIIFNLLGEQVFSSLLLGKQENKIDLSNLAKGCYLVKLSNSGNISTQKLIKK